MGGGRGHGMVAVAAQRRLNTSEWGVLRGRWRGAAQSASSMGGWGYNDVLQIKHKLRGRR